MSEVGSFLGVHWKGDLSWNTDTDRQILISERQWMALVKCCQVAQAVADGTTPAIQLGSWLEGFQLASQRSFSKCQSLPFRQHLEAQTQLPVEISRHQKEFGTNRSPERSENSTPHNGSCLQCDNFVGNQPFFSSSADGESGDSVAADPRNDATPDTSVKGVRDDA